MNPFEPGFSPCAACGGTNFVVVRRSKGTRGGDVYSSSSNARLVSQLAACSLCRLVGVNPRPSSEDLIDAYSGAVDEVHGGDSERRIRSFERALNSVLNELPSIRHETSGYIVDIGCASGEFPEAARRMGFEVTGYEPSRYLSAQARQKYGVDVRTGPFEPGDFNSRKIDVVTMWDVLEHIESPDEVLTAIKSSLKEGGYLLLNLPMIDTFSARVFRRLWPFYLEVHLHYFTMSTIKILLERHNFEIIYSKSYTQTLGSRYLVRRATAGRLARFPFDVSIPYRLGQRTIVAKLL